MKRKKQLPSRLAELRERDPARFLEACRRGGRNSAIKRKQKKRTLTSAQIWAELNETDALERLTLMMHEATAIAFERNDHLLPDP